MKKFLSLVLSCAVLFMSVGPLACAEGKNYRIDGGRGFAELASKLLPSVVNISTEQTVESQGGNDFGGSLFGFGPGFPRGLFEGFLNNLEPLLVEPQKPRKVVSLGSGFIIDASGLIVTNYHVIANAQEIQVKFSDNTSSKASVVGFDEKTDLAVLKVQGKEGLVSAKLGDSDDALIGEWVLAIGNPFGLGGSVSVGIISGRARDIDIGTASEFLQTDAAINRGHSGGPLFNARGEVIGVNTAIISPQGGGNVGVAFAIPSNNAARIISVLSRGEKVEHGWLGIVIQRVTESMVGPLGLDSARGALVSDVAKGSPAERGGLKVGDVVLEFNGKKIDDVPQLTNVISKATADEKADMIVLRDGKVVNLKVVIGKLSGDADKLNGRGGKSEVISHEFGITIGNVPQVAAGEKKTNGVVILRVDVNSDAYAEGLRKGDILVGIDAFSVSSMEDFAKVVDKIKQNKKKDSALLLVKKGDSPPIYLPVKIKR